MIYYEIFFQQPLIKKGMNEITNASNQFGFVVRDLSRQQIRSKVRKTRFDKQKNKIFNSKNYRYKTLFQKFISENIISVELTRDIFS